MNAKSLLMFSVLALAIPGYSADEKPAGALPAIEKIDARPSGEAFGRWNQPKEVRSAADAEKFFEGASLEKVKAEVDFEKQFVLVFAWRGSGQDKLEYVVEESFPENIVFAYRPGRTRDLRPHVKVFVLRSNVKWQAGARR